MTKFQVKRTSLRGDEAPAKGLVFERFTRVDERTVDDPTKISAHRGEDPTWWYGEGENHRVVNGRIARDFPNGSGGWFMDFPDLDALLKFTKEHGNCVISIELQGWPCTEIYDDYRE